MTDSENEFEYPRGDGVWMFDAAVTRVVDADTFDLTLYLDKHVDLGFGLHLTAASDQTYSARMRLRDVDTYEVYGVKHDSLEYRRGKRASAYVESLVHGPMDAAVIDGVTLVRAGNCIVQTFKSKGSRGRWLCDLWPPTPDGWDGVFAPLSELLVRGGHVKKDYR